MNATPETRATELYREWSLDRLWDHGLHEDALFGSHLQYFMAFESIMFLAVSAMPSHRFHASLPWFGGAGIALAAIWCWILFRQALYVADLSKRLRGGKDGTRESAPAIEFFETYQPSARKMGSQKPRRVSHQADLPKLVVAVVVPAVVAGLWFALIFLIRA